MSSNELPQWPPRDKAKIIPKDEYARLREFAQVNEIALIGVKKFDGSPQVGVGNVDFPWRERLCRDREAHNQTQRRRIPQCSSFGT